MAILVAILMTIWFAQTFWQRSTQPLEKLTLGAETSLLSAVVWVAQNQGYYREEGLDITIKPFSSGRLSFLAMLKGAGVDISTVAPTPIMFNSFKRNDFSVFSTFAYSFNDLKVIGRIDSGITNGQSLKGKKIGITVGTTSQFFLQAFLTYHDIAMTDVQVVDMAPSDLPQAIVNRQLDAVVAWEPHAYTTQQLLQQDGVTLDSSDLYRETFNFMVMNDFAKSNLPTLKRFLAANLRATEFIKNHQVAAQNIVAETLKVDKQVVQALWGDFSFNLSLNQSLFTTLEDEARWAIKSGLTDQKIVPDYLDFVAPQALAAIKPEAVTIIYDKTILNH